MLTRVKFLGRSVRALIVRQSMGFSIASIVAAAFLVAAFTTSVPATSSALEMEHHYPTQLVQRPFAPYLNGGLEWLNTDRPIDLNELKGRVVVLDFWTLCCINCIHTLPDLAKLEARFPGTVVVIGVHSPKFDNEKKSSSILKAIMRYEIKHPVVNDADRKIWNAYGVDHWPTLVVIDPEGRFYGAVKGEGHLATVETVVSKLIREYKAKGKLRETPLTFRLAKEKEVGPLYFPGKVLADVASNRLFIADSTNHRIVITSLEGKKIAIAGAGVEGKKDGKFAEARFSDPQGMALDGETLYVADRKNHCIRALNLKEETVKTVAGNGKQERFAKTGGSAFATSLNSPWDVLYHNKKLYIAMAGHHQIWVLDSARIRIDPYAGDGREFIANGTLRASSFAQPSGLTTDGLHLFVADSEISAIRSVPLPGVNEFVTTIVGEGLFEFGDKNGKGREVRLQHALGVAYLDGKLYVADTYNSKIKIIDPFQRTCETFVGEPDAKTFFEPGGLSIGAGKIYVADTNNHRIAVVDMQSKEVTTLQLQGVEPVRHDAVSSGKGSK